MASTLASIRDRVEAYLVDSSNVTWATGTLDEGIRQALAGVNAAYGTSYTISSLDSAVTTTLPTAEESWVVTGAAGYAANFRVIQRMEKANLNQAAPGALLDWARWTIGKFDAEMERVRKVAADAALAELEEAKEAARAADEAAEEAAKAALAAAEVSRIAGLQTSSAAPHSALDWTEEPPNWD